eukprot:Seg3405.1 transcript_id=Seg3405.1/GoldUCD/mRNA.D3Y31 product="hypothetical protein" protein_id=Seg3405.1/GoldUCD/D3Y31
MTISVAKLADTISELHEMLRNERAKADTLMAENFSLKLKNQELETLMENMLETKVNSQINLLTKNQCEDKVVIIQPREIASSKDVPRETYHELEKDVPEETCHELEKQLKAVQIEKHREYLLLKSNEKSCREALGSDGIIGQKEKRTTVIIEQKNTTIDDYQRSPATTAASRSESTAQQQHHWPKGTVLIAGDSIISGINEKSFEGPKYIKVRSFPGATIADMRDYLKPLLRKNPATLILHVGTKDASNGKENAEESLDELLELKNEIRRTLPSCHVIISMPTQRKDNMKANTNVKGLNQKIAALGMERINNNNITEADLGKKKLHLNMKGIDKLANNFIKYLRSL